MWADLFIDPVGRREAAPMNPIIRIQDLHYKYPTGKTDVLKHVNISIEQGKLYGLIGSNGAGKTFLLTGSISTIIHLVN
jgi:ABC-type multidrug transport system ATPase subunit